MPTKAPKQKDMLADEPAGVGIVKDKRLEALADDFTSNRDKKRKLSEKMTEIESLILDRMKELKIGIFRYADREMRIKEGKVHIQIKTVEFGDEPTAEND